MWNEPVQNGVPNMGDMSTLQAPKKPRKKMPLWLKILLIVLPSLLVLVTIFVVIVLGIIQTMTREADALTRRYWDAVTSCDGQALVEMLPEAAVEHICAAENIAEETLPLALTAYLEDQRETMGGEMTVEWRDYSYRAANDIENAPRVIWQDAETYGFDFHSFMRYEVLLEIVTPEQTDTYRCDMRFVQSEDQWCCLNVLDDVEAMRQGGFLQEMLYQTDFQAPVEDYLNALVRQDVNAMQAMVPSGWWLLLEDMGCDVFLANACLEQQLSMVCETALGLSSPAGSDCTDITFLGSETYEQSVLDSFNTVLVDYGIAAEEMVNVAVSFTVEGTTCDNYVVTMTKIDGVWYVYDVMYQYDSGVQNFGWYLTQ